MVTPQPVSPDPPPLRGRPIMRQRWADVAFLHWRVDAARVAPLLPPGTTPDVFDGSTWVGLIPFRMVGAGVGTGPAVPWLGTFDETNVRLYAVDATGRRGVVFRSLEASRLAVVLGARLTFGLPYHWARMRVRRSGGEIEYASTRRVSGGSRASRTRIVVRPGTTAVRDDPLADFLTARWALHSRWLGRSLFVPNQHERWPLVTATLLDLDDTLVAAAGLPGVADRAPESVLWSAGVRTEFGRPQR
ncbi:MAG TPA: DUF2071 domain-containing protein [Actinomycetes bacterium]|nr:DUF2071 domain-containing protein [Actinomycetes bacterium]